jgi:serine/threonine-protein kinase
MEGTELGPYRVGPEIGSGGMGTVYRADFTGGASLGRPASQVALKVLDPRLLGKPGFLRRFKQEAEIGRRIVHGNVVRALDADAVLVDGKPVHFMVMEFVKGQTLRRSSPGPLGGRWPRPWSPSTARGSSTGT